MSPSTGKSGAAIGKAGGLPLAADTSLSRAQFVTLAKDTLAILKRSALGVRRPNESGHKLSKDYTRMVDTMVAVIFQRAALENEVATDTIDMAILGMGGYGRSELAPYSDVDILVLCKRKTALVKKVTSAFVQLMWDVGFELGHAVESLIESESTLSRHMDTRTALFESRWVCGSKRIAREAERQIRRLRRKDRVAFLKRKIKDAVQRYGKYGGHHQLIEPNIKNSPGGLRDYQTLVWLGMATRGRVGLSVLAKRGLLLPGETRALEDAYDFLLRVRFEIHLVTESKQDQLTIAIQQRVAEKLGYKDRGEHMAVEVFMRDYYEHTRTICAITGDVLNDLDMGKDVGILVGTRKVATARDRLAVRISKSKLKDEPLYVFEAQKKAGLRLKRSLQRRLRDVLQQDLKGRPERARMRQRFPSLMAGDNITLVVRSMHETGFLGAVIPEYTELTSLKRYDMYHHYTVDEHSFQVMNNLESLSVTGRQRSPLARLYSEVPDKQVLYLTALLHDVGKIEGRGHARKGAALAQGILKRMGVSQVVIDQVSYLIEIHLLMSHFAQRRDPSDVEMLEQFCKKVKTRTNLKYLCLLTYADLKATSPVVWTDWKQNLLWGLYLRAAEFMARRDKDPDDVYKRRKRALLQAFAAGNERDAALRHLDTLPGRYLLTMTPKQVRGHMKMLEELGGKPVVLTRTAKRRWTEVTFCTEDKPFRLSQLCGVLTLNDCNILFAYAFTRKDGKVIDVFYVEDILGRDVDTVRCESIERDLCEVISGKLDLQSKLTSHVRKWERRKDRSIPIRPKVEFDNEISSEVTVVDVFAMDEPGLLFKVTRLLSESDLVIHRARISTEANRAIDSFDVHTRDGEKIVSSEVMRALRRRIVETLTPAAS